MSAVQTLWAERIARTLVEAGAGPCVVSPGSRSTPLVVALARSGIELVTIIDERTAAFHALGAARATGRPAVLACTSGSAIAHYLPALVEASTAGVPLIVLTADRPAELQDCGASQTIDQRAIFGGFVRGAFDLAAPVATELAFRAVHRKLRQALTLALGPVPGPVHVNVPLRKPLEPAAPSTDEERALARLVMASDPIAPPRLAPDRAAIADLARAIAGEPHGLIVAGAMPLAFAGARDVAFELARIAGYPIVAEAGSQLRFAARPADVTVVEHFDLIAEHPRPSLVIQLGCEPVVAAWPGFAATCTNRYVLATTWRDPESSARVVLGDPATSLRELVRVLRDELAIDPSAHVRDSRPVLVSIAATEEARREALGARIVNATAEALPDLVRARRVVERTAASFAWQTRWSEADRAAAAAARDAIAEQPRSETAVVAAALAAWPDGAIVQIGNSLPIRIVEHAPATGEHPVIAQRGAAGIDGLIASAAGATRAGVPVLLVLGDVSFAHDLGGLLAAREAASPLTILVVDNGGGQIFAGLPIARAELGDAFAQHWLTAPALDPVAVATALGVRAVTATQATIADAIAAALSSSGATVIHAPVSATGAHDVRHTALALQRHPPVLSKLGGPS